MKRYLSVFLVALLILTSMQVTVSAKSQHASTYPKSDSKFLSNFPEFPIEEIYSDYTVYTLGDDYYVNTYDHKVTGKVHVSESNVISDAAASMGQTHQYKMSDTGNVWEYVGNSSNIVDSYSHILYINNSWYNHVKPGMSIGFTQAPTIVTSGNSSGYFDSGFQYAYSNKPYEFYYQGTLFDGAVDYETDTETGWGYIPLNDHECAVYGVPNTEEVNVTVPDVISEFEVVGIVYADNPVKYSKDSTLTVGKHLKFVMYISGFNKVVLEGCDFICKSAITPAITKKLKYADFSLDDIGPYNSDGNILVHDDATKVYSSQTGFPLTTTTTVIPPNIFKYYTHITSLRFPESVQQIDRNFNATLTELKTVTVLSDLVQGSLAFGVPEDGQGYSVYCHKDADWVSYALLYSDARVQFRDLETSEIIERPKNSEQTTVTPSESEEKVPEPEPETPSGSEAPSSSETSETESGSEQPSSSETEQSSDTDSKPSFLGSVPELPWYNDLGQYAIYKFGGSYYLNIFSANYSININSNSITETYGNGKDTTSVYKLSSTGKSWQYVGGSTNLVDKFDELLYVCNKNGSDYGDSPTFVANDLLGNCNGSGLNYKVAQSPTTFSYQGTTFDTTKNVLTDGDFSYIPIGDGKCVLTSVGGSSLSQDTVTVPDKLGGLSVIGVTTGATSTPSTLLENKTLNLPDSVVFLLSESVVGFGKVTANGCLWVESDGIVPLGTQNVNLKVADNCHFMLSKYTDFYNRKITDDKIPDGTISVSTDSVLPVADLTMLVLPESVKYVDPDLCNNLPDLVSIVVLGNLVPNGFAWVTDKDAYVYCHTDQEWVQYAKANSSSTVHFIDLDTDEEYMGAVVIPEVTIPTGNSTQQSSTVTKSSTKKQAPKVSGVKSKKIYKKVVTIKFTFPTGKKSAKLNGKNVKSGKKVKKSGKYTLKLVDKSGGAVTIKFTIDTKKPTVKGVKNKKTYKKKVKIKFSDSISGIKSAKLNKKKIKSGKVVKRTKKTKKYKLVVTDKAGNKKVITFKIKGKK